MCTDTSTHCVQRAKFCALHCRAHKQDGGSNSLVEHSAAGSLKSWASCCKRPSMRTACSSAGAGLRLGALQHAYVPLGTASCMLLCQPKAKVGRHFGLIHSCFCWLLANECAQFSGSSLTISAGKNRGANSLQFIRPNFLPYAPNAPFGNACSKRCLVGKCLVGGAKHGRTALVAFCCAQPLAPSGCCLQLLLMRPARPSPPT